MKLALIGATGFVGSHLLKEALSREHIITAVARDPQKLQLKEQNLIVKQGDVSDENSLAALLKGNEVLLSVLQSRMARS